MKWDESFPIDFDTISPLDTFSQTLKMDNNFFLNQSTMMEDKTTSNTVPRLLMDNKVPSRDEYNDFLSSIEKLQREEFLLTQNLKDKFGKLQWGENKYIEYVQENTTKETMRETIRVMKEKMNHYTKFLDQFELENSSNNINNNGNSSLFEMNFNTNNLFNNIPPQSLMNINSSGGNLMNKFNFKMEEDDIMSSSLSTDGEDEMNSRPTCTSGKIMSNNIIISNNNINISTNINPTIITNNNHGNIIPGIEILVVVQPSPQIVANRYVTPAPEVKVSLPKMEGMTYLIVAKIVYYGSDVEVLRTTTKGSKEKGNPILEGITQHPIAKETEIISFHKIKISEVSSKHGQRPFAMIFSIEGKEQRKNEKKVENKVLTSVHTEPFYVQSRAIKKRALPLERTEETPVLQEYMPTNTASNVPSDLKLIDITPLLIHPQKKAAKLLQISESMMCKRWKEATNRKWPFRSIQKYLKLLKQLKNENQDSKNGIQISIIYKKLKQALEPVSISFPLNKNVPVFPPLNLDDLDSLNVEDDKDDPGKGFPKNKRLKSFEDDSKKKISANKNKELSSEMETDVEVTSPSPSSNGQIKKDFNNYRLEMIDINK